MRYAYPRIHGTRSSVERRNEFWCILTLKNTSDGLQFGFFCGILNLENGQHTAILTTTASKKRASMSYWTQTAQMKLCYFMPTCLKTPYTS